MNSKILKKLNPDYGKVNRAGGINTFVPGSVGLPGASLSPNSDHQSMMSDKKYKFKKYLSKGSKGNYVTVNKYSFFLSKECRDNLSTETMDIFYDTKLKAIKLVSPGKYKVSKYKVISINLSKLMPLGRYYSNKEGIYILKGGE